MEDPYLTEQNNRYAATFALTDLCPEFPEQRFDVLPLNVAACRVGKDSIERTLVLPPQALNSTTNGYHVELKLSL